MCVPRSSTSLLIKLGSSIKHSGAARNVVQQQISRKLATIKCGGGTQTEVGRNTNKITCPFTYISIVTIFATMVIMNSVHGYQTPATKKRK